MKKNRLPIFRFKKPTGQLHIFLLGAIVGFFAAWISKDDISLPTSIVKTHKVVSEEKKSSLPFDQPASSPLIKRYGYTLSYDGKNRNPKWVYEHLTKESVKGSAETHRYRFQEDDSLPDHFRATLDDYYGSGYDRNHLCPAADQKSCSKAMYDTFYLSNASPVVPELSKGYWGKLERQIRLWTEKFNNLYVVTGPLYLPQEDNDGSRFVKYRLIGPHDVAVPTHYYKIVLAEKSSGEIDMRAFLIPNEKIDADIPLEKYLASIKTIEGLSGLEFFKDLKADPDEIDKIKTLKLSHLW